MKIKNQQTKIYQPMNHLNAIAPSHDTSPWVIQQKAKFVTSSSMNDPGKWVIN